MKIVFENKFFVVVDKPSGVLSVPSRFPDKDKRLVLGEELQKQLGIKIFPCHRLDEEVSGLIMYAKDPEAHKAANRWFENKLVQKTYWAKTSRVRVPYADASADRSSQFLELSENQFFDWKCKVLRGKRRAYESSAGKLSHTLAKIIKIEKDFIEWELQPVTGRSHQLRFDLARYGFPILGDQLYGSEEVWDRDSIALKSIMLEFLPESHFEKWELPDKIRLN